MALVDDEASRARLTAIEQAMRELDPSTPAWWALVPERNALRDVIDHAWRDARRFGTRPEFERRLRWPSDVAGRMRASRAYIEEYRGVRMSLPEGPCARLEAIEARVGAVGLALGEWIRIVDRLAKDAADYAVVLRDAIGFEVVEERWFSVLMQGEGDYCWAIARDAIGVEDPPVFGLRRQDRRRFALDRAPPHHHYGAHRRITEFIHATLAQHHGFLGPHRRLAQWKCPYDWKWRSWESVWEPTAITRHAASELREPPSAQRERARAFFTARGFEGLDEAAGLEAQIGAEYAAIVQAYDEAFGACLEEGADYSLNELVAFLEDDEDDG
jgi:hypothetical protein